MTFTQEQINILKQIYIKGTRVILNETMNDPNPILSGQKGTVYITDDMGIIHVNWDNGRTLGLIPEEDNFNIIN